ncbi:MAG: RNA 2',3'-cyclic phosphodiesterase [Clostridiaceae bacterium]|nr:RNA 2',3'-cyclic phosphodiesterase [Clostridiaceae bacterium]
MRLFIAILFSPDIKSSLLRAVSDLRMQSETGVFSRPENLHLTLAFLGEIHDAAAALQAMEAAGGTPFSLATEGCGRFGELWWAGVRENPALSALARRLRRELDVRQVPYDHKPFHPHITLARQIASASPIRLSIPERNMTVSHLSLMKSERLQGRLTYTEIGGCNLH